MFNELRGTHSPPFPRTVKARCSEQCSSLISVIASKCATSSLLRLHRSSRARRAFGQPYFASSVFAGAFKVMTDDEIRAAVIAELNNIAPESDAANIDADADLREVLDIDSLDFLNFLAALHKKTGVNVPEADYAKLATLNRAVAYIVGKTKR
jgi:acyl carrier protein